MQNYTLRIRPIEFISRFFIPFFIILLLVTTSIHGASRTWANRGGPKGSFVRTLVIDPQTPATLFAGASGGGVYKSTDGGEQWRAVNSGLTNTSAQALVIDPQNPTTLYAGTDSGVYKTTDGGESWSAAGSSLSDTNVQVLE